MARSAQNIHRSPNGERWVARWRTPDNKTRKKTFDTKREAELWKRKMDGAVAGGDYRDTKPGRVKFEDRAEAWSCLLYTSPSPRDATLSRMPSSA